SLIISRDDEPSGFEFPVEAPAIEPAARGAIPSIPITFLRFILFMVSFLLSGSVCTARGAARTRDQLRILLRVAHGLDIEAQHHRMVLVDRVVTMHRISSQEVAEAEEQFGFGIVLKSEHVLSTHLNKRVVVWRLPVDQQGLELLEVNVNWMLPAARAVLQDPMLDRVLLNLEADLITVEKLSVYLPLAVAPLELERPGDTLRAGGAWQIVIVWIRRGVHTIVSYRGPVHDDFHHSVSLACRQHVTCWATPVGLLETVLEIQRLPGILGKVDDDVRSLGYREAHAFDVHRERNQVSVRGNLPEHVVRV